MNINRKIILVMLVLLAGTKVVHSILHHERELEDVHEELYHEVVDRREKVTTV